MIRDVFAHASDRLQDNANIVRALSRCTTELTTAADSCGDEGDVVKAVILAALRTDGTGIPQKDLGLLFDGAMMPLPFVNSRLCADKDVVLAMLETHRTSQFPRTDRRGNKNDQRLRYLGKIVDKRAAPSLREDGDVQQKLKEMLAEAQLWLDGEPPPVPVPPAPRQPVTRGKNPFAGCNGCSLS